MTSGELLVIGIVGIIGIAAGLILRALSGRLRNGTPGWRSLLTLLSAALLMALAINARDHWVVGVAVTFPGDPVGFPHVCPCIAAIFIGILAVLHVLRGD
jgi:hypothetical protein